MTTKYVLSTYGVKRCTKCYLKDRTHLNRITMKHLWKTFNNNKLKLHRSTITSAKGNAAVIEVTGTK